MQILYHSTFFILSIVYAILIADDNLSSNQYDVTC